MAGAATAEAAGGGGATCAVGAGICGAAVVAAGEVGTGATGAGVPAAGAVVPVKDLLPMVADSPAPNTLPRGVTFTGAAPPPRAICARPVMTFSAACSEVSAGW